MYGGGDGVEGVRCKVGTAVHHADECERFREEEGMRPQKERGEGHFDRVLESCLPGGILHDSSVFIVSLTN